MKFIFHRARRRGEFTFDVRFSNRRRDILKNVGTVSKYPLNNVWANPRDTQVYPDKESAARALISK